MTWLNIEGSNPISSKLAEAISEIEKATAYEAQQRAQSARPEVMLYTFRAYQALFAPEEPGKLSYIERHMIALRVAHLLPCTALVGVHSRGLLRAGGDEAALRWIETFPAAPFPGDETSQKMCAILEHVDRLCQNAGKTSASTMERLKAAGLTGPEIVTLTQIVGFTNFYGRVLMGLGLRGDNRESE